MRLKLILAFIFVHIFCVVNAQEITFEWNKIIGNQGHTSGLSLEIDTAGFIYAAGTFDDVISINGNNLNANNGKDGFIFKLDSLGNLIWSKQFAGNYDVKINALKVDQNNDIIVIGDYKNKVVFDTVLITNNTDTVLTSNVFLAKFNVNGGLIWAKNTSGVAYDGNTVNVDESNNILIAGQCVSVPLFDTLINITTLDSNFSSFPVPHWEYLQGTNNFIAKYSSRGNKLWIRTTDGNPRKITANRDNNIIITGSFYEHVLFDGLTVQATGSESAYLAQYDSLGQINWVKQCGGSANWNAGYDVLIDDNNQIYQSGQLLGNDVNFDGNVVTSFAGTDAFIAKYNQAGNLLWYKILGSPVTMTSLNYNFNSAKAMQFDHEGNIMIAGYFLDTLSIASQLLMVNGAYDLMLLKMDTIGNVLKALQYSDYGWVEGNDIVVDAHHDLYLVGMTTLENWDSSFPSYGFIGKIDKTLPSTLITSKDELLKNDFLIFPNPSNGIINIVLNNFEEALLEVYSSDGRKIMESKNGTQHNAIYLERSGIYWIKITEKEATMVKKVIVK